eukprot:m51a1_g14129 putative transforming growth factor-beta receptor-associated protein 1 (858) ;mRNA; r:211550-214829
MNPLELVPAVGNAKRSVGARRPVERLEVLGALGKLLALCPDGGGLALLNMYTLELVVGGAEVGNMAAALPATLEAWRTASAFCTQEGSAEYSLCVYARKRLCLYEYTGAEPLYHPRREIPLPEGCQGLVWHGPTLCCASKRDFVLVDADSGARSPTGIARSAAEARAGRPLMRLVDGELLVVREAQGWLVDLAARDKSARQVVQWRAAPSAVAVAFPYVVALLPKAVEARSLRTFEPVQELHMDKATSVPFNILEGSAPDGALLASSSNASVYLLIEELIKAQQFTEALELFKFTYGRKGSAIAPDEFSKRLAAIHMQAALNMLEHLRFSEAFEHFGLSDADPRVPIGYFPDMAMPASPFRQTDRNLKAIIERQLGTGTPATVEGHYSRAQRGLLEFIERRRTVQGQAVAAESEEAQRDTNTALAKLYALFKPSALVSFFKIPGVAFHPDDLEDFLRQQKARAPSSAPLPFAADRGAGAQCWNAVALLYRSQGKERQALETWEKMGKSELVDKLPNDGVAESIETLARTADEALVRDYAGWLLARSREATLTQVFLSNARRPAPLSPDAVVALLTPLDGVAATRYLEYALLGGPGAPPGPHPERLYTRLATLYAGKLDDTEYRERLCRLLRTQGAPLRASAQAALARSLGTQHYEVTLAAYEQLGQHDDALCVMLRDLQDEARAERYCERQEPPGPALLLLLRLLLRLDGRASERVVGLLTRHCRRIDALEALAALPDMPLDAVLPFLSGALQASGHARRSAQVERGLSRAVHLQATVERVAATGECVVVDEATSCDSCAKPIGAGRIFARVPQTGQVLCYRCCEGFRRSVAPRQCAPPAGGSSGSSSSYSITHGAH